MNALVMGRRGTGKTTLAMHLAQELGSPIVVFDVRGEFRAWPESTVSNIDDLIGLILETHPEVIVYRPPESQDLQEEFSWFITTLRENDPGEYTILIDEAPALQTPQRLHPSLAWLVNRAPREVHVIQTFQRPTHAHGDCQAQATDWYIFRTSHRVDLETLAYRCSPGVAEEAEKLAPQEYVHWSDLENCELVRQPRAWFVDLKGGSHANLSPLRLGTA